MPISNPDAVQDALVAAGYVRRHCPVSVYLHNELFRGDVLLQRLDGPDHVINAYRLRPEWTSDEGVEDKDFWLAKSWVRDGQFVVDLSIDFRQANAGGAGGDAGAAVGRMEAFFARAWRTLGRTDGGPASPVDEA